MNGNDIVSMAGPYLDGTAVAAFLASPLGAPFRRIYGASGDWVAAKIEQSTARTRADAKGQEIIETAIAKAAGKELSKDQDLVRRAGERLLRQELRRQDNLEVIGRRGVQLLALSPPPPGTKPVSAEFVDQFERFAADVSEAEVKELFAKVMAGEVRKPGSFSRRTLAVLHDVEKGSLEAMALIRPWVTDNWIVSADDLNRGQLFLALVQLSDLGFINPTQMSLTPARGEGGEFQAIEYWGSRVFAIFSPPSAELSLPGWKLTLAGEESFRLLEGDDDQVVIDKIGTFLKRSHPNSGVMFGPAKGEPPDLDRSAAKKF